MQESPETFFLVLAKDDGLGQIAVDLEAFFDFGLALSGDLHVLATTWLGQLPQSLAAIQERL